MKKINFFFFGFGQTAKYFVRELVKSKVSFTFCATNTKKTKSHIFEKKNLIHINSEIISSTKSY